MEHRRISRLLLSLVTAVLLSTGVAAQSDTVYILGALDDDGQIGPIGANPGETADVEFFYSDPTSNLAGYTIAVCFDCAIPGVVGSFTIDDTFVFTIGAEFIAEQVDNDPDDGDGCELVLGILLDAAPPFDGQTMPPTAIPLKIGTFSFIIDENIPCFTDYQVDFCDGINGTGLIIQNNAVVIDQASVPPISLLENIVTVPADSLFVRGDTNNDGIHNAADIVYIMNFLFQDGPDFQCKDAADTNDDGVINITDPVFLALYLFLNGLPLPAPFPDCGLEPIPDLDDLSCNGPVALCPFCP